MRSGGHIGGWCTCWLVVTFTLFPVLAACAQRADDVAAFEERRTKCDHFRGEEAYDKQRAAFLREQMTKYCSGTDAELAKLKRKYARDPAVMKALNAYEERVE